MFCPKCGKEIPEGGQCTCETAAQQQYQQQPQQQYQQPQQQYQQQNPYYGANAQQPPADKKKLYSMLCYIPLVWLVGMLSAENKDQRVRFHVGQGIIHSIYFGICCVVSIILSVIFSAVLTAKKEVVVWGIGTGVYTKGPSIVAGLLSWLFAIVLIGSAVALGVMAVQNIRKNQDKPLPIIGKMAFYR